MEDLKDLHIPPQNPAVLTKLCHIILGAVEEHTKHGLGLMLWKLQKLLSVS